MPRAPQVGEANPENFMIEHSAVVIGEHTLGIVRSGQVQVLRASVIRGAPNPGDPLGNMGLVPLSNYRPATRADFDTYRIHYHPDYLVKN